MLDCLFDGDADLISNFRHDRTFAVIGVRMITIKQEDDCTIVTLVIVAGQGKDMPGVNLGVENFARLLEFR